MISPTPLKPTEAVENSPEVYQPHKAFVIFCEDKLRYENGFKAWLFIVPYLLGALALELVINPARDTGSLGFSMWLILPAYLIFFPPIWQRILRLLATRVGHQT